MRSLLASSLEGLPAPTKIVEAESGVEALRFLPREDFDLVVTDIDGLEPVSFIENDEKYASIPLIIVSTEGSDRDREKGLGLGANADLVKPFDPDDLRPVVTDLLAASGSEGEVGSALHPSRRKGAKASGTGGTATVDPAATPLPKAPTRGDRAHELRGNVERFRCHG